MDGPGSTWTSTDKLRVGHFGSGMLNITGGGAVSGTYGLIGNRTGSTGIAIVDGVGSSWQTEWSVTVGESGNGTLKITDGGAVGNLSGYIGLGPDSTGDATVDGVGSTWTNTSALYVGYKGSGTLSVTNGGTVSGGGEIGCYGGSMGKITVDGAGSTWTYGGVLLLGKYGNGTVNITNGGTVNGGDDRIGRYPGSTGEVTVDGASSTWTSNSFRVGFEGDATLSVTGGGAVLDDHGYIGVGRGSTGEATVDGAGSTWTNTNELYVGSEGSGTLNITNGGVVSDDDGYIGRWYYSSSTALVTVDGAGSTWANSGDLYVSYYGSGRLNITNGGLVSVGGLMKLDVDRDGDGFVNMASGGMLALYGDADDSLADFMELVSGTDAIRYWDDSFSDWADITGATYGEDYWLSYMTEDDLAGYTMLTVGVVPAPLLTIDIDIRPGSDANPVNLKSKGVLPVTIFGDDDLDVSEIDLATLALDGATPTAKGNSGNVGSLLDVDGDSILDLILHFSMDELSILPGTDELVLTGMLADGTELEGSDSIRIVPLGDANGDGFVDDTDLSLVLANWNNGTEWSQGNFDGDDSIGNTDLSLLLANWHASSAPMAGEVIPEPTTLLLLSLGVTALLLRRR